MNVAIYKNPNGFTAYGAAKTLWQCKDHEVIISGPYETGKTLGALFKFHCLHAKYPGAQGLMVRKTYNSLCHSAVVSFESKVLPLHPGHPKSAVKKYGGEKPEWYDYPNGSRIIVGGLDKAEKFLSAEFDFIYVNQAEELRADEWETLSSRCTGRAGNSPYPQMIGDCNPSSDKHWILSRAKEKKLTLLYSKHEDNPTLFNPADGSMTEQGKRTMATLDRLTGVRKKRGKEGLWVAAEGQVYEFDPARHMITESYLAENKVEFRRVYAGVDWGYTNPGVMAVWAEDSDGRLYRIRETYRTKERIGWWVERGKKYNEMFSIEVFVCDPSEPAYIDEFRKEGLNAVAANNSIEPGIDEVNERLAIAKDGRPRIFFLYDVQDDIDRDLTEAYKPLCTEDEFSGYVYPSGKDGKNLAEQPIKKDDHGMDMTRYMCMYLRQPQTTYKTSFVRGL